LHIEDIDAPPPGLRTVIVEPYLQKRIRTIDLIKNDSLTIVQPADADQEQDRDLLQPGRLKGLNDIPSECGQQIEALVVAPRYQEDVQSFTESFLTTTGVVQIS
jgi:hypothetical protein